MSVLESKNRLLLQQELQQLSKDVASDPHDDEKYTQLVKMHYQAGHFLQSRQMLDALVERVSLHKEMLLLYADIQYLLGDYGKAEVLYKEFIAGHTENVQEKIRAERKLLMVYYQTNRFNLSQEIFQGVAKEINHPLWELMKAFGDHQPYQVDWYHLDTVNVPFIVTDPLPLIELQIDGKPFYALIDTGGDSLLLDNEFANELGIARIAARMGTFGGGLQAEIGFAVGKHLNMGKISIPFFPTAILPTRRFSPGFAEGKYTISAILGTGVLKQFLSTIDYPNHCLTLRPRTAESMQALMLENTGRHITEVPFALHASHMMIAKGSINGVSDLSLFVDSGLDSPAAMTLPKQTLEVLKIPLPETRIEEGSVGGGGGIYPSGLYALDSIGLGALLQEDKTGEYGSFAAQNYWGNGFILDGLISHQFLRHYSWTLDFDEMRFLFVAP
jgi:tetratricopeptide (TPR) repeat protein